MKTAQLVKKLQSHYKDQNIRLYKCNPPMEYEKWNYETDSICTNCTEYIVVSAISIAFDTARPETFIFPADEDGNITSWGELDGSYQGGMDHGVALKRAGYEIVE